MFTFDLAGAVVKAVALWRESKRAQEWARLLFSLGFSGFTSGLGVAGLSWAEGSGTLVGFGHGCMAASSAMLSVFLAHPYTRGFTVDVARDVVEAFQRRGVSRITRAKE